MPIPSRLHRPFVLFSFSLLLVACGGEAGGGSSPGPTPGGPSSQQLDEANSAALHSTFDPATKRVTLQWGVNVTGASRYQIEQQDPSGEWVVVDGVWAPPNGAQLNGQTTQYPQWTGVVNGPTTYRVQAVVSGGSLPLGLAGPSIGTSAPTSITVSAPTQLPSIELDQPEPLESPVKISLVGDGTYYGVSFSFDTPPPSGSFDLYGPPLTTTVDPASYTTGTHLIYGTVGLDAASSVVISRSVRVHTSKAALRSIDTLQTTGRLDINVVATSDSNIVSVGIVDEVTLATVTAPNTCVPLPCAAGQPFNAYRLSIDTKDLSPGYHFLIPRATDSAGNTAHAPQGSGVYIPTPANATLDSPIEGAMVTGTLHVSGSFLSGTPGPLELMITLSGVPVYDTTVANTGANIPYSADVSLAGVAPGYHTLNTYARVGDTNYTQTASALIQVAKP